MKSSQPKIADKWMFFFVYPIIAFLVVHVGNDNSFSELIQIPSYYTDLLLALCCSLLLGIYIRKLVQWVEHKYSWIEEPKLYIRTVMLLGIILPSSVILGIELIYLYILDIKLEDSSIFYLELPLIIILCLIINLIYIVLYQNALATEFQKPRIPDKEKEAYKQNFIVQSGRGYLNIPTGEVAYFKIQNKLSFLITQNGKSYLYDFPFKEIIDSLPPDLFFQLNRQIIAKRTSIVKSVQTETRRLKIDLDPSIDEQVFVSKIKATDFMNWFQCK